MAFTPRIKSNGEPCCFRTREDGGMAFPSNACQPCKDHAARRAATFRTTEDIMKTDFISPNPYAGIADIRAAEATPMSTFEDGWKDLRFRALDAEHAEIAAHIAAAPGPRLTAAELAELEPPDPWTPGIKALQLKETR